MEIIVKNNAQFLFSIATVADIPMHRYREVSFFGASNVGKSSIINAVCNQRNLAKTSKNPGRTQFINFFTFPPKTVIVDVPGYGFAHTPTVIRQNWQNLLLGYLESRQSNLKAYLLIDSRRFVRDNDLNVISLFQQYCISFVFVMTKFDKLNKSEQCSLQAKIKEQFGDTCRVLITSAKNRFGIDMLKADINAA
ncbi:MAG: ribosome biogenesis GTP-binding protein YihA/YsxC [Holosporales bacterium]|jgi:GTP-binding protein|nr:ribosome biogenesis GTP-binding protein YihA/YsxC [Holosporales bacterium]